MQQAVALGKTAFFEVRGEIIGKGRPRFTTINGRPRGITPEKTVNYENIVRLEYEQQCGGIFFDKNCALRTSVIAFVVPPKSTSKKRLAKMLSGEIRPGKKPDEDNIKKAVNDALNKVAYSDDNQIVESSFKKLYALKASLQVTIDCIAENG